MKFKKGDLVRLTAKSREINTIPRFRVLPNLHNPQSLFAPKTALINDLGVVVNACPRDSLGRLRWVIVHFYKTKAPGRISIHDLELVNTNEI